MQKNNSLKLASKILGIASVVILMVSLYLLRFAIYGFVLLVVSRATALIASVLDKKRYIIIIGHIISVLFTIYLLFAIIG